MVNEALLIKDNIKNLRQLNEWVSRNDIVDAIENGDIIYIYYAGDKTVNRGFRTIEPFTLGIHKSTSNMVLRAYQQAGASDTKKTATRDADKIPNWRLFRLDGITSAMKTFKTFDRSQERLDRLKYNPDDKEMSKIIATINISDISDDKRDDSNDQNKKSFFDKQTRAFKSFSQPNQELNRKKEISDLYGLVKFNHKKDPLKYIVVDKGNDRIWYDKVENEKNYKPEEVLGNLNTLYGELTNSIGTMQKRNKSFFQQQYKEFENSLQNN